MDDRKRSALQEIAKSLFTASEALREALDTADLENAPLTGEELRVMAEQNEALEKMAQTIKRRATL